MARGLLRTRNMFDQATRWVADLLGGAGPTGGAADAAAAFTPGEDMGALATEAVPARRGEQYLPGGGAWPGVAPGGAAPDKEKAAHGDDVYKYLAAKFNRTGEHGEDDLPNTVTDPELMAMVFLYKNIDEGRGDLTIDTRGLDEKDAGAVRDGYMKNIARMMQTKVGRQMLLDLQNNTTMVNGKEVHHKTSLRGYFEDVDKNGFHDDYGAPLSGGNAEVLSDDRGEMRNGRRGPGSDASVGFNGDGFFRSGTRSDVVLAHELSHALRATRGETDTSLVDNSDNVPMDTNCPIERSEHQAVGIGKYANAPYSEDVYRRERQRIGLAKAPGVVVGDKQMENRDQYNDSIPCGGGY